MLSVSRRRYLLVSSFREAAVPARESAGTAAGEIYTVYRGPVIKRRSLY